ncbi:GGDEF domain-containing protein [Derxia gummosa]|uniref:diguanylate cyclase n=1 Tax=Derxia gummosa DSM 723 TaxID=1121388 RepID=A0A8B6X1R0_9BURK|nr:GGDEF domain-containing protein [Derxia gummosa]
MDKIIDYVADVTGERDRDAIDLAVAQALFECLDPDALTLFRLFEDDARERRLMPRAVFGAGYQSPLATVQLNRNLRETLPRVVDDPLVERCVNQQAAVRGSAADGRHRALFPLASDREVIAVMEVLTRDSMSPREQRMALGVLRILRNHLAILDYSEHDTLTGLLNRKTFDGRFNKLVTRVSRAEGEAPWFAIADIDRFKSINDNFGHLFGDEVLLLLARLMRENFRGGDKLYRFGGEEFIVTLDRATADAAESAFERLRHRVEAHAFPQVGRVTISLGFTTVLPGDLPANAIERADTALYYAKENGRNRVCGYEHLVSQGLIVPKTARAEMELF